MKNGKVKVFALVSALLLAVCAFAVAACDFTFRTKELTKIEVDSSNVQKVYHPGDDFDENAVKRALVVTAYYDDDTHAKVNSSGFRVVPVNIDHLTTEETQTAGRDTVKVVYGEHESSYDVTITEVTSLRVDAGGLDVSFRQDESHTSGEIDHDGLKVYMVYNDGSEELLPADKYTVTADLSKAGNAKATVTTAEEVPVFERGEKDVITGGVVYKQFTAEYDINVIAHNLTGIKFVGEPTTKNYYVGDPFDPKGIQVVGIYEGEGEKPIELSSVKFIADGLEGGVFTKDGEITVTATFGTFTTENSFTVTVDKIRVESISFNSEKSNLNNLKTDYYDDDTFSAAGLVIDVVYNDTRKNKSVEYDSEKTDLKVNAPIMSEGKLQVTVIYTDEYGTATTTYDINVTAVKITGMSVKGIKSFFVGDEFDPAGITATITYNKESLNADVANVPISDDRLTATANNLDENDMLKVGSTVTVTFDDGKHTESVTENITVTPIAINEEGTSLTVPEKEGGYFVGDEFDITAIKLHVVYNHGDPKDVNGGDAGVEVTVKGLVDGKLTESGEISISVTYTDDNKLTVTKKATITVTAIAITEIDVDASSVKKEGYFVGDTFDPADLKATVKYNNSEKPVEVTYPDDRLTVNFTEPVNGILTVAGDAVSVKLTVKFSDGKLEKTSDVVIEVKVAENKNLHKFYAAAFDGSKFSVYASYAVYTEEELKASTLKYGDISVPASNETAIDGSHIHLYYDLSKAALKAVDTCNLTIEVKGNTYNVVLDETDGTDWNLNAAVGIYNVIISGVKGGQATIKVERAEKSIKNFYSGNITGDGKFDVYASAVAGCLEDDLDQSELVIGSVEIPADANATGFNAAMHAHLIYDLKAVDAQLVANEQPYELSVKFADGTSCDVILSTAEGGDWDSSAKFTLHDLTLKGTKGEKATLKVEDKPVVVEKSLTNFYSAEIHSTIYYVWMTPKNFSQEELSTAVLNIGDVATTEKTNAVLAAGNGTDFRFAFDFSKVTGLTAGKDYKLSVKIGDKTFDIICTGEIVPASETATVGAVRISLIKDGDGQICFRVEDAATPESFEVTVTGTDAGTGAGQYQLKVKDGDAVASGTKVEKGTVLVLTVTPNEGFTTSVKVNGSPIGAQEDGTYEITVTAATTITITFASATEEPEIPEITVIDIYNAKFIGGGIFEIFIRCTGIDKDTTKAKAAFKLLVGDKEVEAENDVAQEGDYFKIHYNLLAQNLAANTYTLKVKVNSKTPFERDIREGNSTYADTANNKTYTIKVVGGQLTLTVADGVKGEVTELYGLQILNNTQVAVWFKTTGFTEDSFAKAAVLVDDKGTEVAPCSHEHSGEAGQYHLFFDVKDFGVGVYTLKVKVDEKEFSLSGMTLPETPYTDGNNNTFTFTIEGGELTLTVAAGSDTGITEEDGTVKLDIAKYAAANSWADATAYTEIRMGTNITVTVSGSSNTGKYYNNGNNWRIYQNESPTLTFTAVNGITIVSVKITYTNKNTGILKSKTADTTYASNEVIAVNAATVSFTVGNTDSSTTNGQVQISAIEVVYSGTAAELTNQQKADAVKNSLTLTETTFDTIGDEVDLPTTNDYDAVVVWTVKTTTDLVKIEGNKLTVEKLPDVSTKVTLHVAITVGSDGSAEKEFTISIDPKQPDDVELGVIATFNLGADGEKTHVEGSSTANYNEQNNSYTLEVTDGSQLYQNARDAKGNGGFKVGASKNTGSFSFTVPDDIKKVVIYVAGYKTSNATIKINGTAKTITTLSNNGEYTACEVDTSETKTVKLETTTSHKRCMVDKIEFWGLVKKLSDEEKVQAALDEIEIEQKEFSTDFELPTTSVNGVTLTWSVEDGGDAAKIDETNTNLLIVPQETEVTFALVVTATCNGSKSAEKRFEGLTVPEKGSEPEVQTWKLVTSESDIKIGAKIVFVSSYSSNDYYCNNTEFSSKRLQATKCDTEMLSSDKSTIKALPNNIAQWTVGGQTGAWTFHCENLGGMSGYLSQISGTKQDMELGTTVSENSQWTITVNSDNNTCKIQSKVSNNSRCLSYNTSGSQYFAAYVNDKGNISIYVLA